MITIFAVLWSTVNSSKIGTIFSSDQEPSYSSLSGDQQYAYGEGDAELGEDSDEPVPYNYSYFHFIYLLVSSDYLIFSGCYVYYSITNKLASYQQIRSQLLC